MSDKAKCLIVIGMMGVVLGLFLLIGGVFLL